MATNIVHQIAAPNIGDEVLKAEARKTVFTPEQSKVLGQVYRLIMSWSREDTQTIAVPVSQKES